MVDRKCLAPRDLPTSLVGSIYVKKASSAEFVYFPLDSGVTLRLARVSGVVKPRRPPRQGIIGTIQLQPSEFADMCRVTSNLSREPDSIS